MKRTIGRVLCFWISFMLIALPLFGTGYACAKTPADRDVVNHFFTSPSSPILEPGESGVFSFYFNNPSSLDHKMENISLSISIYSYATKDEAVPIDDVSSPPTILESGGQAHTFGIFDLPANTSAKLSFTVETDGATPHGDYLEPSSYFLRFYLMFTYNSINYTYASRGYFNDTEWTHLVDTAPEGSPVNMTYLHALGYDGIIPDSSFTVRIYLPLWPWITIGGSSAVVFTIGLLMYIEEEHPGKYPRLEKGFKQLRGKAYQAGSLLKKRPEKP